ncbi:MAG: hypothetical protein HZS22_07035 [Stenotrophomonas maltophilia]|nr:hypothetical protein [Stenotrophomonas maltophilia]
MSAYIRDAHRTPAEVLNSLHYLVHELDVDRLQQAQQAVDLISLIETDQPSPITLDHVAAVAAYVARDLAEILGNAYRPGVSPAADCPENI